MVDGVGDRVPRASWLLLLAPPLAVGGTMLVCIGMCVGFPCVTTGVRYGMWVDQCPATDMRLSADVQAAGLLRGQDSGALVVSPRAQWLTSGGRDAGHRAEGFTRGISVAARLVDSEDRDVPGFTIGDRDRTHDSVALQVRVPEVPDGDYRLLVDLDAGFEATSIELPVPLYTPAIVHTMTDRPLYKPGQSVSMRSVALKRTDQTPLDGRPGRWEIYDPSGQQMHVERDEAGAFGIADSSFPLDARAQIGTWRVAWHTGDARDEATFEVRPFKLPRFTVEVEPAQPWFSRGDDLVVTGNARYTSGAPIARAPVSLSLSASSGRWPMPLAWEEPVEATTQADGSFEIRIGTVPGDLLDRAELGVVVRVTEPAGEVAAGGATAVLTEDNLTVEAVTELGDGLVDGFNNRAYLRVATPDGRPLRAADVRVRNPYDPTDTGRVARSDEDGVLTIQLDPGDPVTVVHPAPPVRVRPMTPAVAQLDDGQVSGRSTSALTLAERRALDAAVGDVARCGVHVVGNAQRTVGLRVTPYGAVAEAQGALDPASACVVAAMRRVRFPAATVEDRAGGGDGTRSMRLTWTVPDTLQPSLSWTFTPIQGAAPGAQPALQAVGAAARRCLPRGQGRNAAGVANLHWSAAAGSKALRTSVQLHSGSGLGSTAVSCLRSALSTVRLEEPATTDAMGFAKVSLRVPMPPNQRAPQATTSTGYELSVAATSDGGDFETTVVLPVGHIPPLRMRATPSLAHPGDTVTIDLLRGPDFASELPETLWLRQGTSLLVESEVEDKSVSFVLPDERSGFFHVEAYGARAVIFVQPPDPLEVSLTSDQAAYGPGESATLTVHTTAGDAPVAAGVGLVGVDSALAQLAPLLGPDTYGRVTVRATSDQPAFGAFDPRALTLGQVRGENAAKAAVLRISSLPMDPSGDHAVSASAAVAPETVQALTTNFYRVLARTVQAVRTWERDGPEDSVMEPGQMVVLWSAALADARAAGEPVVDGWGRELTLAVLPSDLLAQVDPRQVVSDSTRLPEDVTSWPRYVAEEVQ